MVLRKLFLLGCINPCSDTIRVKDPSGDWKTFYVRDKVDTGGFSRIDLVVDKTSRRLFALKRISCHSKDDEIKALREANFHLSLHSHPNLLPCVAIGLQEIVRQQQGAISEVLLVLCYSKRGTLQKEIDIRCGQNNAFSIHSIRNLMIGICEGLLALLSLDTPMCHRDLKPGNVLLFEDMRPVLMDFGSVTPAILHIKNLKDAGKWKEFAEENCSLTYRAPEFFNPTADQDITEKADIWSLGCLLYALFFFKSPMDIVHSRGDSVALAACSSNIFFPKHSFSQIPSEVMNLLKSMLSAKPESRPSLIQILEFFKNLPTEIAQYTLQNAITCSL
uniref:non-specific serine/threonine protein kinase n=1 Tax=Trichobilharzia regenti TaxID=157069 RepID=A0AA85ITB4_TRIRE|nr:unnamed protein product [Trichobilharzia regenti]